MKAKISRLLGNRGTLLVTVLLVFGSMVGLLTPVDVAQSATCAFRPWLRSYYSDASHTTLVGQRGLDCSCNDVSWGDMSDYMVVTVQCCFQNLC
ncbi:MAG TPA: DUF6289 family protein [Thermoanaerobaculia bacterium]|nr:DUF6289 family protein [Thermoanaerobaculia bacterium]